MGCGSVRRRCCSCADAMATCPAAVVGLKWSLVACLPCAVLHQLLLHHPQLHAQLLERPVRQEGRALGESLLQSTLPALLRLCPPCPRRLARSQLHTPSTTDQRTFKLHRPQFYWTDAGMARPGAKNYVNWGFDPNTNITEPVNREYASKWICGASMQNETTEVNAWGWANRNCTEKRVFICRIARGCLERWPVADVALGGAPAAASHMLTCNLRCISTAAAPHLTPPACLPSPQHRACSSTSPRSTTPPTTWCAAPECWSAVCVPACLLGSSLQLSATRCPYVRRQRPHPTPPPGPHSAEHRPQGGGWRRNVLQPQGRPPGVLWWAAGWLVPAEAAVPISAELATKII